MTVSFFAAGRPETKGSVSYYNGHATNDNPRAKAWARVVSLRAREAMQGRPPIDGPVSVRLSFIIARPKGHYRVSKRHGILTALRPSAPVWPAVLPDLDKMIRCALDAMTKIVYVDDGRVVTLHAEKHYQVARGQEGVHVTVEAL